LKDFSMNSTYASARLIATDLHFDEPEAGVHHGAMLARRKTL
jgi:hypothetical protein